MTARRKSPIEPLLRLREQKADAAARSLADAARTRSAADERAAASLSARARVEQTLAEVRTTERQRLEAGALSAGDLAQAAKWGVEEARRRDAARAAAAATAEEAKAAAAAVIEKRSAMASAKADVDAASRLVAKARSAELVRDLAAAEEAAEDAFAARSWSKR